MPYYEMNHVQILKCNLCFHLCFIYGFLLIAIFGYFKCLYNYDLCILLGLEFCTLWYADKIGPYISQKFL